MNKEVKLGDIVQLRFGIYDNPTAQGDVAYLQAGHFDDRGNQTEEIDTYLQSDAKYAGHQLDDGDILLAGKGNRNFAWTYHHAFGPAVASSMFFVISPDRRVVLPEFLTTLFNMPHTQTHFQTLGAGSSIPSIRKSELESFRIIIPPSETQQKVVAIQELLNDDIKLSQAILDEKKKIYRAMISKLILSS